MFTYKIDGKEVGRDFETIELLSEHAEKKFSNSCDSAEYYNGEVVEGEAEIFTVDEYGNETFLKTIDLFYTHYHGDYAEHNTNWGL